MVGMAAVPTVHIRIAEAPVAQGRTLELIVTLRTRVPALEPIVIPTHAPTQPAAPLGGRLPALEVIAVRRHARTEVTATLRTRLTGLEAQTRAAPVLTIPIPAHSPRHLFTRMHLTRRITALRAPGPIVEGLPEVVKPSASSCATLAILMADLGT
jgi:hypothetical protein